MSCHCQFQWWTIIIHKLMICNMCILDCDCTTCHCWEWLIDHLNLDIWLNKCQTELNRHQFVIWLCIAAIGLISINTSSLWVTPPCHGTWAWTPSDHPEHWQPGALPAAARLWDDRRRQTQTPGSKTNESCTGSDWTVQIPQCGCSYGITWACPESRLLQEMLGTCNGIGKIWIV